MSEVAFELTGRFGDLTLQAQATVPATGITALVGASGSGKTTLLRCLAGLARAHGRISVAGAVWQDETTFLPPHSRGVGYVFQEPSLLSHLTVRQNLAFAEKRAPAGSGPILEDVVTMLGIGRLLSRGTGALSGGERQRVAIARALLSKPVLLLMDEPLTSLDPASKAEVMPYLEQLHRELALPVIYVSHAPGEIARLADRVLRIEAGRVTGPVTAETDPLAGLSEEELRALAKQALLDRAPGQA